MLVDDHGTRAVMTAHWLRQMGWDVAVLDHALAGADLETGSGEPALPLLPAAAVVPIEAAAALTPTAAALGLYLWRVEYPPGFGLPADSAMIDAAVGCGDGD